MNIKIPKEIYYNGGIDFRFFPGGVSCVVTFPTNAGFRKFEGWAPTDSKKFENFNCDILAKRAYVRALESIEIRKATK